MDWSVFMPALAANLTGQAVTLAAFLYIRRLHRFLEARFQEAQADEQP